MEEECECWIIQGYGIDGVCRHCLNKKIKELNDEIIRLQKMIQQEDE